MDDEIDIEEHDILEHPQVKALFPDLSKIQIHLQSSGAEASFLDEPTNLEVENLLEERLEYADNDLEDITEDDLSKAAQECDNDEEHFTDNNSGDSGIIDKNDRETHEISDSEPDDVPAVVIDSQLEEKNDEEHEVNDVQVISEDENDELRNSAKIKENKKKTAEFVDVDFEEIPKTSEDLECNNPISELSGNIHQISDDEDQGTNGVVFIENTSNAVGLFEDAFNNMHQLMQNAPKNMDQFQELPEYSNDFIEEILGTDAGFIGPVLDKDNLFEKVKENNTGFIEGLTNEDGFIKKVLEKDNRFIEEVSENFNRFVEESPESNDALTVQSPENNDGFIEEVAENDERFIEETPEKNDGIIEETREENDESIEETQEFSKIHESIEKELDRDMLNPNIDEDSKYSNEEAVDYHQISVKEEIEYEPEMSNDFDETLLEETYNNDELPPEDIYHFKNKIILGSKPSPNTQGNLNIINKKSYLVVLLDDWSVHLNHSQSYCSDCKTLFTTPNALDAHRMTAHSLLAPINSNRAVKSTALSSVNVAKKSTANKNDIGNDISNSTYCNHCNVTFKDHTTLIKHLYKLLPAKQYTCNICDLTFQNQNDLVNHNEIHIKIEQPRKYLKAKKSRDNPILRKMLNLKRDPNKLKRCLTIENITNKPTSKVKTVEVKKEPKEDNTKQCRYKCLICSDIFDSYSLARGHRVAHPETPINELLKKLPSKRANPNNSKDKLTYEDDNSKAKMEKESFQLIPTSALFQCSKCEIHFTTALAGQAHFSGNKCNEKAIYTRTIWSCPTCKKKLRKVDENSHKKQHELSNKIKIYKLTKNTYERALCKCVKCNVYFEYIMLKRHLAKCGKITTAKCKICDILFPSHKLAEHTRKHDVMKLKKKDFILIDYADAKDAKTKKTSKNIAKTNPLGAKKIKQEPKITIKTEPGRAETTKTVNKLRFEREKLKLYFCKHCKSFLSRRSLRTAKSNKLHLSKKCVKSRRYTFSNCQYCGLRVFAKTRLGHEKLHTIKKLTINNFEFYDFATLKRITPPIPKYPCCNKCQIHFLHRNSIRNHICGEDYENCEVCGDKFENSALEVHLQIHRVFSAPPKAVKSRPKIIPELIMKYESLNAMWNILFICGKCDLVTDLYNKAVEHSQSHLKKEPHPNTIKCYICNLKFEESCWSKHSALHSRMPLVYKDFKILKYAPENLLDEAWFQMFETLPEKDIRQIIDRSVFGSERSLKMKLIKDGLPEFTVYCCSNCHVSYDNNDILNHVRAKCKVSSHFCKDCEVAFDSAATLDFHNQLHMKGIKQEEFRIVHFVKPDGTKQALNAQALNKYKCKAKAVIKKPEFKAKNKTTEKSAQFVLYRCKECTVCVHVRYNQDFHICAPDHHIVFCKICKQNFSFRQKSVHAARHNRCPEFRAKNIKVILFEPTPEGVDKPTYGYRRKTDSKRTNKRGKKVNSIRVKKELTSPEDSEIESESPNSSHCSSVNSFETLDTKSSKNPTKLKGRTTLNSSTRTLLSIESNDTEQTDNKTAKLYKCDCGLHYTSLKSVEKHTETCDSSKNISKEKCSKCGLLFPTDILVSHLCKHHSRNTKIITVQEVHRKSHAAEVKLTQKKPTASVSDGIKLYKCSQCNVYFLNQSSCYKHISKHVPLDPKEYIECKMCSFQFRILSLHIHMRKHHEKEFKLEKVLVEEYQPSVGKQAPKIDIYFANDKLQNVQVSSSND